jgi:rod shape-determining protein MreB
MVVDIGGGTTEIALISLSGVVYRDSIRVGGDRFDEAIVAHVRRRFGCLIGDATAERIKQEVGCVWVNSEQREIDVRGRHLAEGVPRTFTLNSTDVMTALEEPVDAIIRAVRMALEQSPPELAADIAEQGIVLTGGGALLRDLDARIAEETGLPVLIAEDPLTCVVRGGGMALELMDNYSLDLMSTE